MLPPQSLAEVRRRQLRNLYLSIGLAVVAPVIAIVGFIAYIGFGIWWDTRQLDAIPLAAANYQGAALDLVRLCQSTVANSPLDQIDPLKAPPSISRLRPEAVLVDKAVVKVFWGGGFYHRGWLLERDITTDVPGQKGWTLSFTREMRLVKVLQHFTASATTRFSQAQFDAFHIPLQNQTPNLQATTTASEN